MAAKTTPPAGGIRGRQGLRAVEVKLSGGEADPRESSIPPADLVAARYAREAAIDHHLVACREAEVRQDRRRALAHLLAAIGLVLTRDSAVAGQAAREVLGRGGDS